MKKTPDAEINTKLKDFYRRWNFNLNDEEKWTEFKNRALNSYSNSIGITINMSNNMTRNFFDIVGEHFLKKSGDLRSWDLDGQLLSHCPVYLLLINAKDMRKFMLYLQSFFWINELNKADKGSFFKRLKIDIDVSQVPVEIMISKDEFILYPAGAKLLDNKLVNDNLLWLEDYSKAHATFLSALNLLDNKTRKREVVDNLRLTLELFLRQFLGNNKSLENQKEELFKMFKVNNTGKEISNLYWQLLDYYSKYQNSNAKHGDEVKENDVEFLLYLTGTFIRFLIKSRSMQ